MSFDLPEKKKPLPICNYDISMSRYARLDMTKQITIFAVSEKNSKYRCNFLRTTRAMTMRSTKQ